MPAAVRWLGERELSREERAVDPWPWPPHSGWSTRLELTITEGKNRQIRRLCQRSKLHVRKLHRLRIGPLQLGQLAEGCCRVLTATELRELRRAAGGRPGDKRGGAVKGTAPAPPAVGEASATGSGEAAGAGVPSPAAAPPAGPRRLHADTQPHSGQEAGSASATTAAIPLGARHDGAPP